MEAILDRLRRKANQAWEMAGCARQDGDYKDEERYTAEAREYETLRELCLRGDEVPFDASWEKAR